MKVKITIIIFFCTCCCRLQAQDLHFSQFHATPLNVNPSLTGAFDGDMRYMTNFRSQWSSVPVPYTTFSLAYDQRFFKNKNGLSGGLVINYDQAGDAELSLLQIGGTVSYVQSISKTSSIAIGGLIGAGQRRFKTLNLTFDEQFVDGTFSSNNAITETFPNTSFSFADMAIGINWQVKLTERLKFNLGSSAWHLNEPKFTFLQDDDSRLPTKFGINLDASIQLSPKVDILPSVIYFIQGAYHERIFGAYWKYYLDDRKGVKKALLLGTWYRLNDSAITSVALDYEFWRVGISYDINTSDFAIATRGRGGFELSAQYIIAKVKPIKEEKVCPIF